MGLLAGVLLLTVAIPFAGGLAGAQPETKELSLVSVFAVHGMLLFFLACYYALSRLGPVGRPSDRWRSFPQLRRVRRTVGDSVEP